MDAEIGRASVITVLRETTAETTWDSDFKPSVNIGKRGEREEEKRETEKERGRVGDGERKEKESWRDERSPPCMEKRAESGDWSEKDDERRWR
ncbi:hypothetical protein TNCV_2348001 [Trichonephila clavipes]|uniref:Uncharacterized protein n=1 Tax=Trichonephila clavipes TaxID=2585209 RepID=A0A8X6SRN4_TRICX|nr:hypothetical protein TNCV_2348001 [Trichonephila clavipes]